MARVRRQPVRDVSADAPMSAGEYRKALESVGLTVASAARFLGVAPRTGRTWANDEAPVFAPVALLLRFMVQKGLTAEDVKPSG